MSVSRANWQDVKPTQACWAIMQHLSDGGTDFFLHAWKTSVINRIVRVRNWEIGMVPSKVYKYVYTKMQGTCVGQQLQSCYDFGVGLEVGAVFSVMNTVYSREVCAMCAATSSINLRCGGCRNVWYCGKQCQQSHWRIHKSECKRMTARSVVPCVEIPEDRRPLSDDARFTTPELFIAQDALCVWPCGMISMVH